MSTAAARSEIPVADGSASHPAVRPNAITHHPYVVHQHIRQNHPGVAMLSRAAWVVFQALATFIRNHEYGYPSQGHLAHQAGYSVRSVQAALAELRLAGLVTTWRIPGPAGYSKPLRYAFGASAEAAFASVNERFPRTPPSAEKPGLRRAPPPAIFAAPPPAETAHKPLKREEPSFCEAAGETAPSASPPAEEEPIRFALEDREIAIEALALRWARKHPTKQTPRSWDREVLALVTARVAETTGTRAEKLAAQAHAITGAWQVSNGPPSVKFVWGSAEHFCEHALRGEKKAKNDAFVTRTKSRVGASSAPPPATPLPAVREAHEEPPPVAQTVTETVVAASPKGPREEVHEDAGARQRALANAFALIASWETQDRPPLASPPQNVVYLTPMLAARAEVEAELVALRAKKAKAPPPEA